MGKGRGRVGVVGGGAAGFFAAITCAEADPGLEVVLLERGPQFLSKVRISGGGRCNVTHACFEPRELAARYPRGGKALIGAFSQFQPRDTVAWFEGRGVRLKTEADGRMFPVTDRSSTIVDCLTEAARQAGVRLRTGAGVAGVRRVEAGGFEMEMEGGGTEVADRLLLATGGCRAAALGRLATALGHRLEAPVPSLFTLQVEAPWLRQLAGVAVPVAEVSVPRLGLKERGAVLVTHWGLSGPAVLRLSAWGARALHGVDYRFVVRVNWLPEWGEDGVVLALQRNREQYPARRVVNQGVPPLTSRLWEHLVIASGMDREMRWSELSRGASHRLVDQLRRTDLAVTGKSLNKDEFVTCGGVPLKEVDLRTMESRVCPGLHLAGELLDVDGVTGGFNFQAAWTTGWLAGRAMAGVGLERNR
jgi:predicted Rossmann fold flavoprotein